MTPEWSYVVINTLRSKEIGSHFADDIFKRIFLNENISIPINISLKFVPRGSINNIPALFQIMAWRRPGDKPLSEPTMVNLLTHICVTRPQWVKRKLVSIYLCGLSKNSVLFAAKLYYLLSIHDVTKMCTNAWRGTRGTRVWYSKYEHRCYSWKSS